MMEVTEKFAACPTCGQYSHSIGDGIIAEAALHFEAMYSHRGDGFPTQHYFDHLTRDMAQRLLAELAAMRSQRDSAHNANQAMAAALAAKDALIIQLGENAAKAAGEYAERVAALEAELARRDANENRNCINWGPCSRHDKSMADPDDYKPVSIRAALTEPTDG